MKPLALSRRLRMSFAFAGLLLVWAIPGTSHAAQADAAGTQLYTFGLHLFQLGEYYRAITELKRFTLLFPQHQRHTAARLLIGLALQEDGLYDDAFIHFRQLRQDDDETDVSRIAAFKLGELHFLQKRYQQAIERFQRYLQTFPETPLAPNATYLLGLSWALDGQTEHAQHILASFPAQHALANRARALQHALQTAPPAPSISPRTAGVLAGILPGAGHLYLGKSVQALTAFLLNGIFLTGAAFAFHEGFVATGAILLYFETGWYLGNIKSATEGARDAQRQHRRAFADHLRTTYAPPILSLRHLQAPGLGLHLTF